jgi:hypothetical protein
MLAGMVAVWMGVRFSQHRLDLTFHTAHSQHWLLALRAKISYTCVVGNYTNTQDINMRQDAAPVFRKTSYPGFGYSLAVGLPYWMMAASFSVLPICWVVSVRRRVAMGPNLCPGCGYDLRATPDRCPECGAVWRSPSASEGK